MLRCGRHATNEETVAGQGQGAALAKRIAVGAVALPAMVLLAWVGGWPYLALVAAIVVLGLSEFYRMAATGGGRPFRWMGMAGGLVLCVAAYGDSTGLLFALTAVIAVVLVAALFRPSKEGALVSVAMTLAGILWVGWLGSHLVFLRNLPRALGGEYGDGARYVWLTFALTWGNDTAAYGVGSLVGRHRLFERVSPRKSVEGALGGMVGCVVMCWIARAWFAPFLALRDVWILGLAVGVAAQVGDFVESLFKRDVGVKDASRLIPGHGGVLDRFDSMLFTAPLVYLYLRYAVL